MSLHFHALAIRELREEADDALVVTLDVPPELKETFRHQHGQYLVLRATIGGQDIRRSYSICSGCDEDEVRIGVREVPNGVFSGWLRHQAKVGDTLDVIAPQGHFTSALSSEQVKHYLCVAAGSGITPMLSIARTVLAFEPGSRVTLIYGNRTVRSAMFKEALEDLKNRYLSRFVLHMIFSREHIDLPLYQGRLDEEHLDAFFDAAVEVESVDEAFVCGPLGVIESTEKTLQRRGFDMNRLHVERFGAPPIEATSAQRIEPTPEARLTIIRDGVSFPVPFESTDASILDAASRAGLDVPYSCKSGVCSTCRAKVIAGNVRMLRNFALEAAELAQGFVLSCQAQPLSPEVTLSFDDR